MSDPVDSEASLWQWLHQLASGGSEALPDVASDVPGLTALAAAAARDELRDLAGSDGEDAPLLPSSVPQAALNLILKLIREQPVSVPASPALAALYKVAWAVLSAPEWAEATAAALAAAAATPEAIISLLARLHKVSETALIASEKVAFTGGAVAEMTAKPDAAQPKQGRVGERAPLPPPPATVAPASLHAVRGSLPENPPPPSKSGLDEPAHLRALLWSLASAGGGEAVQEAVLADMRGYASTSPLPPLGPPASITPDGRALAPVPLPHRPGAPAASTASSVAGRSLGSSPLGALPHDSLLTLLEEGGTAPAPTREAVAPRSTAVAASSPPQPQRTGHSAWPPLPFVTPRHGAVALRTELQVLFSILRARLAEVVSELEWTKGVLERRRSGTSEGKEEEDESVDVEGWVAAARFITTATTAAVALHATPGLYTETSSTFGVFHEPLTQVLFVLVDLAEAVREGAAVAAALGATTAAGSIATASPCVRDGGAVVIARVLTAIHGSWEEVRKGNSPKGCLFLLEVDQLLAKAQALDKRRAAFEALLAAAPSLASATEPLVLRQVVRATVPILVDTFASDNSRLVQMGLAVFKSKTVVEAIVADTSDALSSGSSSGTTATTALPRRRPLVAALLTALMREGELHWNATVNKQTHAAITAILEADPEAVAVEVEALFGSGMAAPSATTAAAPAASPAAQRVVPPPPSSAAVAQPPVTITGVAPWAVGNAGGGGLGGGALRVGGRGGAVGPFARGAPPLTVTGVAPWAAAGGNGRVPVSTAPAGSSPLAAAGLPSGPSARLPPSSSSSFAPPRPREPAPGMARLAAHLSALLPPPAPVDPTMYGGRHGDAADATAHPDALALVPTLLPSLAFHDLVFGRELGSGAFSSVKYAKRIIRGLPASTWPEYAVKVISTRVMAELGYEPSVRREIAVLSLLSHPNVCRLVSAFRWREGAYLVLEHAGSGDLHAAITRLGSLEEATARFLLAEVLAALHHVHSKGFVYVDVKPENVLLLKGNDDGANGGMHAKLGDFGACRPISSEAQAFVAQSGAILENLRDGDWRAAKGVAARDADAAAAPAAPASEGSNGAPSSALEGDDERIEGTEEFLAPELRARTAHPTIASDAFAFGVTLYQALCGRLPEPEAVEAHFKGGSGEAAPAAPAPGGRAVRFGGRGGPEPLFGPDFPPSAVGIVTALLHPDPAMRLGGGPAGLLDIMAHPWFAELGSPEALCALYAARGPVLAQGAAAPATDPRWTRRHNSTMWAPLPAAVVTDIAEGSGGGGSVASGRGGRSGPLTLRDLLRVGNVLPTIKV